MVKKSKERPHFEGLWKQKKANGGFRYLLKGKDNDGKTIFVTVPIEERDSDRVFIQKCEEAKIELERKANPPKDIAYWLEQYFTIRHLREGSQYQYRHHIIGRGFNLDNANNTARVSELLKSNQSESSIKQIVGIINTFYKYLVNSGVQVKNPVVGIRTGRFNHRTRIPTEAEITMLLDWSKANPEDELFSRLLLATGARCSTLSILRVGDLSADGHIKMINVKCGKPYDFPVLITDSRCLELWALAAAGKKSTDSIFTNGILTARRVKWFLYKQIPADLQGERISPHSFRHLFATRLLQKGVAIDTIAKLLDHSSIATTLSFYAQHSQEQLDAAVLIS